MTSSPSSWTFLKLRLKQRQWKTDAVSFLIVDDHTQTLSAEQAVMAVGFNGDQWIEELIPIINWVLEYEGKIITAKARLFFDRIPASLRTEVKPLGDPELDLNLSETSSKAAHETYGLYATSLEKCKPKETELFESTLMRITNSLLEFFNSSSSCLLQLEVLLVVCQKPAKGATQNFLVAPNPHRHLD